MYEGFLQDRKKLNIESNYSPQMMIYGTLKLYLTFLNITISIINW